METLLKSEHYQSGNHIIYVEQYQPKECNRKYWRYGFYHNNDEKWKMCIGNGLLNKPKKKTLSNILGMNIVRIN